MSISIEAAMDSRGGAMQFPPSPNSSSVGNRIIDSEHKKLFGMINDIAQLINLNHGVALSVAIKLLNDSLHEYFEVEENIAHAVNFDFANHRMAHKKLSNEIKSITSKILSQNSKWSSLERKESIKSLNDRLSQHIKVDSRPLKIVLDTHLYDFKPD
jgi:hemerythrin-like metal-binding protein